MYRLTSTTSIVRLSDGASIPADPANTDYSKYLDWLVNGNTPQPPEPPTPPTPAAQIEALERATLLPRPVRDVLLALMEKEALAAGISLILLRAKNSGYRRVKELDEQIAALRAML